MKTTQEKLALLEETANAFNVNTLCSFDGHCQYFLKGKQGCAIGRIIEDKELCKQLDSIGGASGIESVFHMLPLDTQAYGLPFLRRLQLLHDSILNWNESGLSEAGREEISSFRFAIENGWL